MLIGGVDHGCHRIDRYVARATELDMGPIDGAVGSQIIARACSDLFAGEGEFVDCGYAARRTYR